MDGALILGDEGERIPGLIVSQTTGHIASFALCKCGQYARRPVLQATRSPF